MSYPKKCIIDNWSLEHAGVLLESTNDLDQSKHDSLIKNLGGLSNFITALLLYEDSYFPINGFEKDWKRFSWFETNASAFIEGVQLDELNVNWNSPASYEDKGISNYLLASRSYESDLLVCPERSEEITNYTESVDNVLVETLREIDKKIIHETNNSLLNKTKTGIKRNFQFPSPTQYVLSEASTREDLLKVIMQLKSDGKIRKVISEIEQITSTTQGAGKFENDIEYLVKKAFGRKVDDNHSWSISVSVPFFSISKSIDMDFFRRKEYLVFLKDLITCRAEAYRIEKDFQRIFKKKLRL
ncbi:MAG: hypothetical protein JNJ65_02905 [Cyclobacteriaceae bacterium]|nr:hypothetical protein [Cyclobacteriaceae bacterium]